MQCGLLGEKLGHSYSPAIHGKLGDYGYDLYQVPPENLASFLETTPFTGLNVTIPYKTAVMPFCAELSPEAKEIGSVNTVLRRADGSLWGHNTDAAGFSAMVESFPVSVLGKKILVLGSGGASRTVCHVLKTKGAREVLVVSRSGEVSYENLSAHSDAQLIVNTTPVGMYPNCGKSPLSLADFPVCEGVLDLIYNPARTALMLEGEKLGIPTMGGLLMLVAQAVAASQCFTGKEAPKSATETILTELQSKMENIILIGMPSSGKSTVGKILAEKLGREFVDADAFLEEKFGRSIPEIFADEGETGFRTKETAVLAELGAKSALVIATGGGCVTREENYPLLHQNGRMVFLKRDIALLETEGRPLSQQNDLEKMYETRLPLYENFADATVENLGEASETVEKMERVLYENFGD